MTRGIVVAAIALLAVSGALLIYRDHLNHVQSVGVSKPPVQPILIPGIREPEEMRVEPIQVEVLTPPERMLGEAMQQAGSKSSPADLLPALDRILAKYPDYADGYVMRLGSLCQGTDHAAILSNINSALKSVSSSRAGKDSSTSLLSMRAKTQHAAGDDSNVMEDLDKAIHAVSGFPDYADAIDRWQDISSQPTVHVYIDMKTFDDSHSDDVKLWIKQPRGVSADAASPYSLQQYELNCARQIRTVSFANYDASGNREGGRWKSVIPDTLGETVPPK